MKGIEIIRHLTRDISCWSKFEGIFAIDQLDFLIPDKECFYICNTDESYRKGKHWIVIYVNPKKKETEFFDSQGKKPEDRFITFMKKKKFKIQYNTNRLQSLI